MMGYFSNGTEGDIYRDAYCDRCVHDDNQDCPIWLAHLLHNYEGANNNTHWLHLFIPRDTERLENKQCVMFIARKAVGDLFD